jgi:hypothetical protein
VDGLVYITPISEADCPSNPVQVCGAPAITVGGALSEGALA